jgi:hypothetical protein
VGSEAALPPAPDRGKEAFGTRRLRRVSSLDRAQLLDLAAQLLAPLAQLDGAPLQVADLLPLGLDPLLGGDHRVARRAALLQGRRQLRLGGLDLAGELAAALAYFEDPTLIDRALALAAGDQLSAINATYLLYRLTHAPRARARSWAFIDAQLARLRDKALIVPALFGRGCSAAELDIATRALAGAAPEDEEVASTLSDIRACAALRGK